MIRLRFTTARQVFEAFPPARDDIEAKPSDADPVAFVKPCWMEKLLRMPSDFAPTVCHAAKPCGGHRNVSGPVREPLARKPMPISSRLPKPGLKDPEENNRRAALEAGMDAAGSGPAAWAALAAGWSGGSLVSEPNQPVSPPDYLTAQAVRAAILTALASVPPKDRRERLRGHVQAALKLIE